MKKVILSVVMFVSVAVMAGCSVVLHKGRPSDIEKVRELSTEVYRLESDLTRLGKAREEELKELDNARLSLEKRFRKEIEEKQIKLEMLEKGLVVTFVDEILFDSGKSKLKENAFGVLDNIAKVLAKEARRNNIAIEGHTDNQPIKHSRWKSNWELSSARAMSVLHYLAEKKGISSVRLSAVGYGEHRPVVSNDAPEGQQQNRRVEIVILPEKISKVEYKKAREEERRKKRIK